MYVLLETINTSLLAKQTKEQKTTIADTDHEGHVFQVYSMTSALYPAQYLQITN